MRALVAATFATVLALGTIAHADRLTPDDLARKNEHGYVTGLPLFAFSTDIGFGLGARAYYYWNGTRDDPRFATTPYLHRIFLQGFVSTRGVQYHWLDYDAPRIADTPFRIRSQLVFGRNTASNYFGHGNAALRPLRFPDAPGLTFESFASYSTALQQVAGGQTFAKYDQFDLQKPLWIASIERLFLGDRVRLLGGLGFSYATIRDYTGKQVDALDSKGAATTATSAPTRLREDCDAGKLVGCSGGREGWLRLGVSYDTRDFEPDPNNGVFADLAIDLATSALGSEYDYVRLLGAVRGYWSPFASDLVLAGRAFLEIQTSETPFFSLDALPFTEDFHLGLGGHRTLRGYRQDRFVGRTMAATTAELRWTFWRFRALHQKFAVIAVPFFDLGRSFDSSKALTLSDWRAGYGAAVRVSWNLATIITVDYGVSAEDTGLYVNFRHTF